MKKHLIQTSYSNGPLSLQTLPEDVFYTLAEQQGSESGFLVLNGLSHTRTPTLVYPIMHSSQRISIGLHRGDSTMRFYLFSTEKPYEDVLKPSVLWEFKCGKWQTENHHKQYRNVYSDGKAMVRMDPRKNYLQIINWVIGETIRLMYTGNRYLLEETIDKQYVKRFHQFNESDFDPSEIIRKGSLVTV